MKLTSLKIGHCGQVRDLTPLKGMPLKKLTCYWSQVSDLSPLEGMSLTEFALAPQSITKGLASLEEIVAGSTRDGRWFGDPHDHFRWASGQLGGNIHD